MRIEEKGDVGAHAMLPEIRLIPRKSSTLHDYPYTSEARKCPHFWIINVTPPGPNHCLHRCIYCYARSAVYSEYSLETLVYDNLPELVEKDLKKMDLCPPISISNVSDPCQPIPELRAGVERLVGLLMKYSVSFAITTKGDPSFLLELPGFMEYEYKFIAITIEGNEEVLSLLSPLAPPFEKRIKAVQQLSGLGINTTVRLDPLFIHLFQALYGASWFQEIEHVINAFAGAGAKHVVCSTGRLSKAPASPGYADGGIWERVRKVIEKNSPGAAGRFEQEYVYERGGTSQGYLLRKDLRLGLHRKIKSQVEARGMTYATCQELSAGEADSAGIAHCQRFSLPFSRKQNGRFKPVEGCTANCHVSCRGLEHPSCGQPQLISPAPFKMGMLRDYKIRRLQI